MWGFSAMSHHSLHKELLDLVGIPFAPLPLLAILDSTGTRTLLRAGEAGEEGGKKLIVTDM